MKKLSILVFLTLTISNVHTVNQGIFDGKVRDWTKSYTLAGKWQFYPQSFLMDIQDLNYTLQKIPENWTQYAIPGHPPLEPAGYGTFILEVKNLPQEPMGVYLKDSTTCYKLYYQKWENGYNSEPILVIQNGNPAKTMESHIPLQKPTWGSFTPQNREGRIIIETANFLNDMGGIWNAPVIGKKNVIKKLFFKKTVYTALIIGFLLSMSLHYLFFYLTRRREAYSLYFSLFSFLLMIRQIFTDRLLANILPADNIKNFFSIHTRLDFISLYLALLVFIYLVTSLFPRAKWNKLNKYFLVFILLCSGVTLFVPMPQSLIALAAFQIFLLFVTIYILFVYIDSVRKQRPKAILGLISYLILFATALNDLLHSREIIQTSFLVPFGFLFFILAQSLIMSLRHNDALTYVEIVNASLGKFIPKDVMTFLRKDSLLELKLEYPETQSITALFADIRDFTMLSEDMTPQESFRFLNSYINRFGPIIQKNNGFIDKFLGDGFIALFTESPNSALAAAVEIQSEVENYNKQRERSNYDPIDVGIGIHTGEISSRAIDANYPNSKMVSDAVTLSARLEEFTKIFETQIILSEETINKLTEESINYRFLGKVTVRGKDSSIKIFEVLPQESYKTKYKAGFELGVTAYIQHDFIKAIEIFKDLHNQFPQDKGLKYYLKLLKKG